MHRAAILSSAASLAPQYLSALSHKRYDFRKKLLNTKCFFLRFDPQLLFETLLILKRIQRDTVITVKMSSSKVPGIIAGF